VEYDFWQEDNELGIFNAIENAFAKLKALLRRAAERAVEGLWSASGPLVDLFTSPRDTMRCDRVLR
jgi:hypothetical protein